MIFNVIYGNVFLIAKMIVWSTDKSSLSAGGRGENEEARLIDRTTDISNSVDEGGGRRRLLQNNKMN